MLPQNRRGVWRWMELTTSWILPWWRGKFTSLKHKLLSEIVRSSESDSEVWTISRNIIAETILRRICSWPFWTGSLPSFWKKTSQQLPATQPTPRDRWPATWLKTTCPMAPPWVWCNLPWNALQAMINAPVRELSDGGRKFVGSWKYHGNEKSWRWLEGIWGYNLHGFPLANSNISNALEHDFPAFLPACVLPSHCVFSSQAAKKLHAVRRRGASLKTKAVPKSVLRMRRSAAWLSRFRRFPKSWGTPKF